MAKRKPYKEPKTGEKFYENWNDRIQSTIRFYKSHWNGWDTWKLGYQLYRGDHWSNMPGVETTPTSDSPRDRITVNLVGSNIRSLLPFLLNRNPKFIAHPRQEIFVDNARLQSQLLDYFWDEFEMQKQVEIAVMDALITGHGIVKTGFKLTPYTDEDQERIEYTDFCREENPFVEAINPFLFFWDPDAPSHDLDTARWCFNVIFKPYEDVLANPDYNKKVLDMVRKGEVDPETVRSFGSRANEGQDVLRYRAEKTYEDSQSRRLVLYDIWDKKYDEHIVMLGGVDEPLLRESNPYFYLDGFPFIKFDFVRVPHEPFALGLPYGMADQQLELNRVRTSLFNHRRRFNRKYLVNPNLLSDENESLYNLQTGEDGTLIKIKGAPDQAVYPIPDASVSADTYQLEAIIKEDIKDITGIDNLMRGANLPSRTSATEVNTRQQILASKMDDYISNTDKFVRAIGRQILQHCQEYMVTPQVMRIAGSEAIHWVTIGPDDIKSEFLLALESTTKPKTDPELEKSQYIQLFGILVQLAQVGVQVNFAEFGKTLFTKMGIEEGYRIIPMGSGTPMNPQGAGQTTGAQTQGDPQQSQMQGQAQPPGQGNAGAMMGGIPV